MKTLAYVRVSTEEQARHGVSLAVLLAVPARLKNPRNAK